MTSRSSAVRMWALEPATYRSPAHIAEFGSAAPRIPFPIYLIEHAEGLVLFDAGLDPDHVGDPAGAYGEMAQRIDMVFDERHLVETHLDAIGRSIEDVTTVVASHLHFDHAGALKRFPKARTILGAGELDYARAPERFRAFDHAELALIEPLRTLRLIHYSAWIARRWADPAFPAAFPWFGSTRYWQDRILELREQTAALEEPPLSV